MLTHVKYDQSNITFVKKYHQYKYEETVLRSVSSILSKYFEFNEDKFIDNIVLDNKEQTRESIKEILERNRTLGNKLHSSIEQYIINESITEDEDITTEFSFFLSYWKKFKETNKEYDIILPEYILFDVDNKIAGTSDLIAINSRTGDVIILDWKMSKEIKFMSEEKSKYPFSGMSNCNYNRYSLQLNAYRVLLNNYMIGDLKLNVIQMLMVVFHSSNNRYLEYEINNIPIEKVWTII